MLTPVEIQVGAITEVRLLTLSKVQQVFTPGYLVKVVGAALELRQTAIEYEYAKAVEPVLVLR